jgi:tetratricopeptide (TPR) repeat protein
VEAGPPPAGPDRPLGDPAPAAPRGALGAARAALTRIALRRAAELREQAPATADRLLSIGSALAPVFGDVHVRLVELRRDRGDRAGALAAGRAAVERFPGSPDAWMLLAGACLTSFRQDEALAAYERAITIEERPDALTAAGELYARAGRHADAAARFARAHAAGAGPDALLANARALAAAGDRAAAEAALALWAGSVPDGTGRIEEERARLERR